MLNAQFLTAREAMRRALAALAVSVCAGPAFADTLSPSCAETLKNRAIEIIVPSRAGGGYDTYARAIASELGNVIGTRVSVSNLIGGGGMMAMSQVVDQNDKELLLYIDGLEEMVNTTDSTGLLPFGSDAFDILGVIYTEPQAWLAPAGTDLRDPDLTELVFSASSLEAIFVPVVIASKALGFSVQVVAGYGGSGETIAAVLRGETDVASNTLTTSLRGAADGDLEIVALVSDMPSSRAPDVPTLFGPGSIFEERSAGWTEAERAERQKLAEIVLDLAMTRRSIFTSSSVHPDVRACLRTATDNVLGLERLSESLERQGRNVEPILSAEATQIFEKVRASFKENAEQLARMIKEFGN